MAIFGGNKEDLPDEPNPNQVELGDRVKDLVTGWEGVVSTRTEHLNGCIQFGIDKVNSDGKIMGYNIDEQQLEILEKAAYVPPHKKQPQQAAATPTPGGPTSARY